MENWRLVDYIISRQLEVYMHEKEIEDILEAFKLSPAYCYTDHIEVAEHFYKLNYRVVEFRTCKWENRDDEHGRFYYRIREPLKDCYVSKKQMDTFPV